MAEARRATVILIPSEVTKTKHLSLKTLNVIYKSVLHRWNKKKSIVKNRFANGLYPSNPGHSIYVFGGVFISIMFGYDPSYGIIDQIELFIRQHLHLESPRDHIVAAFVFSMGTWITLSFLRRKILKYLLSYQGWINEVVGPKTWKTRIWFTLVHLLRSSSNVKLYSYQSSLPKLPLPRLDDTIERYLISVRPLKTAEEFKSLKNLAHDFQKKFGFRVQLFLYIKYLISSNYVSDWWEQFVYLSCRAPLIINSNYYGMDALYVTHKWLQSARAANLICAATDVMNLIKTEEFQPILLQNVVPLCSSQYQRMFGTTRIPKFVKNSKGADELIHNTDSSHIVILHKGRFFKCSLYSHYKKLHPVDIEEIIQSILRNTEQPDSNEKHLPILTAGERNHWALTREKYFSSGVNKKSLDCIESAAFILVLDETDGNFLPTDEKQLDEIAHALIHGKGYDRWFDKSFNIIVFKNGRAGFNAEHSWADAPIVGHMWEHILLEDVLSREYGYTPDGHCRGIPALHIPVPERLKWDINDGLSDCIHISMNVVKELIDDIDIHVLVHNKYGKGFMKKCKVSPDAYIQIALQLTYYRLNGEFCQTYESSMTRLFRDGRTETVRSCSSEVCEIVKAMDDKILPKSTKILYFRHAADHHQQMYRNAMTGKGVDRHLFCMYVICRFLNINSEFLNSALSQPWKLSTSQTPLGQTKTLDLSRYPNFVSAGGGFGPVADDGYGVSYMIAGEDRMFFHISSKLSCKKTSSKRFADELLKSFNDIKEMFS